jgi:hypothetical protein
MIVDNKVSLLMKYVEEVEKNYCRENEEGEELSLEGNRELVIPQWRSATMQTAWTSCGDSL